MVTTNQKNSAYSFSLVMHVFAAFASAYEEFCHHNNFNGDVRAKQENLLAASCINLVVSFLHLISGAMQKDYVDTFFSTAKIGLSIFKVVKAHEAHDLAQRNGNINEINDANEQHRIAHSIHWGLFAVHAVKDSVPLVQTIIEISSKQKNSEISCDLATDYIVSM